MTRAACLVMDRPSEAASLRIFSTSVTGTRSRHTVIFGCSFFVVISWSPGELYALDKRLSREIEGKVRIISGRT